MKSTVSILVASLSLGLLSACGGDGGDSSAPPSGGTPVTISASNQTTVVRAAVNAGLAVSLSQGSLGSNTATASSARAVALGTLVRNAVNAAQRRSIASATVHPASTSTQVTNCDVSGSFTTTFNDNDNNNTLSVGDVVTATFSQCVESAGLSINSGQLTVVLTSSPTAEEFLASANFQNIVVVDNGLTSTTSGNVTVDETDFNSSDSTVVTVGNGGMTVAIASANYTDTITFASGATVLTSSFTDGHIALSMTGTFTAQSIGGAVSIATPLGVTQQPSQAYPNLGQFIVTGAAGSNVRATVLDDTQVKLELDANGDGTYESTTNVPWSTLIP